MVPAIQHSVFLYLVLSCLYPSHAAQGCLNKQKVLTVIRQMQQFLKGQETHFTDGIRTMKAKLSALQISVTKLTADQPSATWCPSLEAPKHGKKFGSRYSADHEVHFVCQPGYQLIGSSTRVCQPNGRWTGVNASCTEINECASNPCQNGGLCVDAVNQYTCTCINSWMGRHCQYLGQTEWSDLSFNRKPRCAEVERTQRCSCDAGFHMSGSSENSVCQDVNECEVFQLEGIARLCMYNCVNIPGSYRCTCPPAYKLLNDGRSCADVDECATLQHNCTAGETCINTGGGFQCVNPQCPEPRGNISYVKTSPFQCERHPCPMNSKSCHHVAKTISFHYLSLPSKLKTPVTLFRMATAAAPGRPGPDNLRFGIVGKNNQGQFVVQRSDRQTGELILVQPLKGPCTVEVDVDMSEYRDRTFQAKHVSKVTLFISANGF
ncbi:fibulin-7 isoform X1 [Rhincodon typus]|uniref:fibulin-7 isoform X1 n=1 Tax=Rhincodon typus TaxID=259920 RepID=UPI00202FEE1E|nr:fibulin-7 isoform X1 [Rhincodon typus]